MSVAENIALVGVSRRRWMIDWRAVERNAAPALSELGSGTTAPHRCRLARTER
jgi:ABC-type sugar transport system ATPase subunit